MYELRMLEGVETAPVLGALMDRSAMGRGESVAVDGSRCSYHNCKLHLGRLATFTCVRARFTRGTVP